MIISSVLGSFSLPKRDGAPPPRAMVAALDAAVVMVLSLSDWRGAVNDLSSEPEGASLVDALDLGAFVEWNSLEGILPRRLS